MDLPKTEPVSLTAVITAALIATVNLIAYVFDWSETATQLVNVCLAAWVVVAAMIVRMKVTPNSRVALTEDQLALIQAGQEESNG